MSNFFKERELSIKRANRLSRSIWFLNRCLLLNLFLLFNSFYLVFRLLFLNIFKRFFEHPWSLTQFLIEWTDKITLILVFSLSIVMLSLSLREIVIFLLYLSFLQSSFESSVLRTIYQPTYVSYALLLLIL